MLRLGNPRRWPRGPAVTPPGRHLGIVQLYAAHLPQQEGAPATPIRKPPQVPRSARGVWHSSGGPRGPAVPRSTVVAAQPRCHISRVPCVARLYFGAQLAAIACYLVVAVCRRRLPRPQARPKPTVTAIARRQVVAPQPMGMTVSPWCNAVCATSSPTRPQRGRWRHPEP